MGLSHAPHDTAAQQLAIDQPNQISHTKDTVDVLLRDLIAATPTSAPELNKFKLILSAHEQDKEWQVIVTDQTLTPNEVAEILGVSRPHLVNKYIKRGLLKATKVGTHYRIKESDVRDFLRRKQEAEATTKAAMQQSSLTPQIEFTDDELCDI